MTLSAEQRELCDYIVGRLVQMLDERSGRQAAPEFVDAAELAGIFGVSVGAIYDSADSLGAIRVGRKDSRRPRIIFNLERAVEAHGRGNANGATTRPPRPARPRATHHAPLLPIKDDVR
jgi:hypothetical protein